MDKKFHLAVLLCLSACTEIPVTTATSQGILTADAFPPFVLLQTRDDARLLGHRPLSDVSSLMATENGRLTLSFLVACALPGNATFLSDGFEFFGELGLAPSWPNRALYLDEQREVSACLFARLNLEGLIVTISLRGPSLPTSAHERQSWAAQEGAFWGNLFAPKLRWYACRGTAPADLGAMGDRKCAQEDPIHPGMTMCGLSYQGTCADVCTMNAHGVMRSCNGAHQVITSFLLSDGQD
jgi:hypothetical protein